MRSFSCFHCGYRTESESDFRLHQILWEHTNSHEVVDDAELRYVQDSIAESLNRTLNPAPPHRDFPTSVQNQPEEGTA